MKRTRYLVLLGALGCICLLISCTGDSDNSAPPQVKDRFVQAFVSVDDDSPSAFALVMDQDERILSDLILLLNNEPMNVGLFVDEDLTEEQEEVLSDPGDQTVNGGPSGDYLPYYFLECLDVNEGEALNFEATGCPGCVLHSSSGVVPKRITLIEPQPDAVLLPGQEVQMEWAGGEPCTHFQVLYIGSDEDISYSSDFLEDQYEYTIPAGVIQGGQAYLFVLGWLDLEATVLGTSVMTSTMWDGSGEQENSPDSISIAISNRTRCIFLCQKVKHNCMGVGVKFRDMATRNKYCAQCVAGYKICFHRCFKLYRR